MTRIYLLLAALFSWPACSLAQYTGAAPFVHERGGLLINEVSNGPAGAGNVQEYIELIVTGAPDDPTAPVDLRGWIVDDNNFPESGQGSAQGYLIFGDCYPAVPPGSIIIIYNDFDPNPALPAPDPEDTSPADGVYVIPHDAACLDGCNSNPSSESPLYCPCTDPAADLFSWPIGLRNPGDAVQVRDRCETVIHAIHWGGIGLEPDVADAPVSLGLSDDSQSDRVFRLVHNVDDNWLDPANYDNPTVSGNETPGQPNNTANAAFRQALSDGSFPYAGRVASCRATDAGDLLLPAGEDGPPPLQLCLGNDLGAFTAGYGQNDEQAPDAGAFPFEYAFLLTQNDGPDYTIVDQRPDGDFDLSVLGPGEYLVWGFSYVQTNGSMSVTDFLNGGPATIADIQAYDACGYDGDLDNRTPQGQTLLIVINDIPAAFPAGIPTQCADENGEATFDLTLFNETVNGFTGLTVNWYEPPLPLSPIPNPTAYTTTGGPLTAVVTNGVCSSPPVSIPLEVAPGPGIEAEVRPVSCAGSDDGSISIQVDSEDGPFSYNWTPDLYDGLSEPAELPPGAYVLTVTDGNGCTSDTILTVTEPTPLSLDCMIESHPSQFGASDGVITTTAGGGTPPYELSWNGAVTGFVLGDAEGPLTADGLPAGAYELVLTDANGCTRSCELLLEARACGLGLSFVIDSINCAGGKDGALAVNITAGIPPYAGPVWSTGQTGPAITDLSAGVYGVTVTDDAGCRDSLRLTLTEPRPLVSAVSAEPPACFGDTDGAIILDTLFGGVPPYQYAIGGNAFQSLPMTPLRSDGLAAGEYTLRVRDALGCVREETVMLTEPAQLAVDLGPDQPVRLGESVTLTVQATFQIDSLAWTPDSLSGTEVRLQPAESTTIGLTAFDANGCLAADEVSIVVDRSPRIYVPNAFSPNGDGVNDYFLPYGGVNAARTEAMRVFDRWGEPVFEIKNFIPGVESPGWDGRFRGQEAPAGMYVYSIQVRLTDGRVVYLEGEVTLIR